MNTIHITVAEERRAQAIAKAVNPKPGKLTATTNAESYIAPPFCRDEQARTRKMMRAAI